MISVLSLRDSLTVQFLIATVLMGTGVGLHLTERHEHEHDEWVPVVNPIAIRIVMKGLYTATLTIRTYIIDMPTNRMGYGFLLAATTEKLDT